MITFKANSNVFLHGGMHTPSNEILDLLPAGTTTYHLHMDGNPSHMQRDDIRKNNFFMGANARTAPNSHYLPCPLGQIPALIESGDILFDYAIINVSPPNKAGEMSFGCSADIAYTAARHAKVVIAQINKHVPFVWGPTINVEDVDHVVKIDQPLPTHAPAEATSDQKAIAMHVASQIEDGDTLQLGIGAIPNMVAQYLGDKKVYVFSEMISDAVMHLAKNGNLLDQAVTSFAVGSQDLVDWLETTDQVEFLPTKNTNSHREVSDIVGMVSINSVIEVDKTGASVCDNINGSHHSGIGGQHDFVNGVFGKGKSFLCLKSTTSSGKSRIVETLQSPATIPNFLADHIVTERGVVKLKGQPLDKRRELLESISA